jgi:hypothetical protein
VMILNSLLWGTVLTAAIMLINRRRRRNRAAVDGISV